MLDAFKAAETFLATPDGKDTTKAEAWLKAEAKKLDRQRVECQLCPQACKVADMERGTIWSPYYKITLKPQGAETVVEVNNIWHQSMAPVDSKEYFYQWPYMVFGDTFKDALILGAQTENNLIVAERGVMWARLTTKGRAAHAGVEEELEEIEEIVLSKDSNKELVSELLQVRGDFTKLRQILRPQRDVIERLGAPVTVP